MPDRSSVEMLPGQRPASRPPDGPAPAAPPLPTTRARGAAGGLIRAAWPLPVLVTLLVGGWRMGTPAMWRDEEATWTAATRPVSAILDLAQHIDGVLSPYYLFMHYWIRLFGSSPFAMRLPSVLAMAAAAGVTAVIGRKLAGPACGVLAGLLFALVPSVSRYAQEARPYAIATFAAALATLLLINVLPRPTWWRWAAYAAGVALVGLSHMIALLVLGGHAVAVGWWLWHTRDRRSLRWPLACAAGLLPVLPIVTLGMDQQDEQIKLTAAPSWHALLTLPAEIFMSGMVAGIVVGLALLAPVLIGRQDGALYRGGIIMLTGVAPGSALLLWLISQARSFWYTRYLLFTTPAWCLLAATLLISVRVGRRQVALLVAAVAAVTVLSADDQLALRRPLAHDHFNYPYPLPAWAAPVDFPKAAQIIRANQRSGDAIMYSNPRAFQALAMDYELRGRQRPKDVLLGASAAEADNLLGADCDRPAACFGDPGRVWVVARGNPPDPLAVMAAGHAVLVRDHYQMVHRWRATGLSLTLYNRV